MAFEDGSRKQIQKVAIKMSNSFPLSGISTLASMESLSLPLVQEIVLSADMQCEKCQKRVSDIITKMNETESVVVNVLEKKVTLTFRLSTVGKVITRQITPINTTTTLKFATIKSIFRFSCG
ncbi:putative heavy metal-associated domain, HMA [Lupinus albus]|uniref:Putative heavy metal-associated domain, HMA n=1 Tax=Lupinus albus TaxID=3870 RepID=A0A6A4NS99_LUPAL|nr:putative heavy metal-associated domain, HMA [Lupinus albus]